MQAVVNNFAEQSCQPESIICCKTSYERPLNDEKLRLNYSPGKL